MKKSSPSSRATVASVMKPEALHAHTHTRYSLSGTTFTGGGIQRKGPAHSGKRDDQPGMNPGDLVNHSRTMSTKTRAVKISWELPGSRETQGGRREPGISDWE